MPRLHKQLNNIVHRLDEFLKTSSGRGAFLGLVVLAIVIATLRPGDGGSSSTLCVICGERGLSDFIANVILFVPFGIAVGLGRRGFIHAVLFGFLFSLFIETAQWRLISGRDASVGDLVSNTTGAAFGWLIMHLRPWRIRRSSSGGAFAVAAVTTVLLLGGLSLFTPNFFRAQYWVHWTPDYESLEQYGGKVLTTRVGDARWNQEPQKLSSPDSVAHLLVSAPLEARFVAGPAPSTLAPIVSISDEVQEEVILIGADGNDLVYRFRARANDLRLDHANLRADDALRGINPGDTVNLAVAFNTRGYCIGINQSVECGRGFTVGQTWSMLFSPAWPNTITRILSFIWLALVFIPSGFAASSRRLLIAIAFVTTVSVWAAPLLIGFSLTPLFEVGGVLIGVMTGHALARLSFFKP